MILGVLAGAVPFYACTKLKGWFKYDDALDTFGIHAVGGTLGALLTGIFAASSVNGNLNINLAELVPLRCPRSCAASSMASAASIPWPTLGPSGSSWSR
jgi:ammonia channel protein AmtB